MKITSTLIFLLFFSSLHAQTVNLVWAKKMGGTSSENGQSIAVDASGNTYTTGNFAFTADFDPGPAIYNLTAVGNSYDVFISKLDASGNFVWANRLGGDGYDYGYSIAVDAAGNVYTAGLFSGTADFDPGSGTFNLTAVGKSDIFISKLDASGNFVWAKNIGGAANDAAYSIVLDASGNVYTTGYFAGTADFDPGPGVFNLTAAGSDIFIDKLDAAGNFMWAKSFAGSISSNGAGESIAVDASGNVYTTGIFNLTSDFDPGPSTFNLTSKGGDDIFISKLDAAGNFIFAKSLGGSSSTDQGYSIKVDALGNIYTTGAFDGTADFDPGSGVFNLTAQGVNSAYISKLDALGNFVFARQLGGSGPVIGYSIALDVSGNIYTTGYFIGTADFDPGSGTFNLTSAGSADIFISKLDAAGNFVFAKQLGGNSYDVGYSVAVDASGNIYSTGVFSGIADFDPGPDVFNLTSAGGTDVYVVKLSQGSSLPVTYTLINAQCRNSNVLLTWQTAQQTNTRKFEVERSNGNSWTAIGSVNAAGNSNNISNYTFTDPSPQANALYRIALIDLDGRKTFNAVLKSSCQQTEGLEVWPNPVYSNVTLQISSVQAAKLQLQLYDSKGSLMMLKQENLLQGSNSMSLNVNNLPAGIYTLMAKWGSNAKATKITKQ